MTIGDNAFDSHWTMRRRRSGWITSPPSCAKKVWRPAQQARRSIAAKRGARGGSVCAQSSLQGDCSGRPRQFLGAQGASTLLRPVAMRRGTQQHNLARAFCVHPAPRFRSSHVICRRVKRAQQWRRRYLAHVPTSRPHERKREASGFDLVRRDR